MLDPWADSGTTKQNIFDVCFCYFNLLGGGSSIPRQPVGCGRASGCTMMSFRLSKKAASMQSGLFLSMCQRATIHDRSVLSSVIRVYDLPKAQT